MAKKQSAGSSDTREKLLRLAARSFGTQGYSATTMRNIAEQAGIEAASIYYHFASKEELVDAVMSQGAQNMLGELHDRLGKLPPGAPADVRLRAAVLSLIKAEVRHGDYAIAHARLLAQLPDKVRERQVKRREQHQKQWAKLMQDLKDEGFMRSDVDVALARIFIMSAINSVHTWFNPRKGSLEDIADQLCKIFFEGVMPAGARTPARKPARKAELAAS